MHSNVVGLNPANRVVVNGTRKAQPGGKITPQEVPIPDDALRALDTETKPQSAPPGEAATP
ncbi:MAG: hypothetical protein WCF18_18985 [Chthoniobacteraceae bacterium]